MKPINDAKQFVADLVEYALSATSSGHPFLDDRWLIDGNRNECYRRPYYRLCQEMVRRLQPKLVVELGIDEGDCCGHSASGDPNATVLGVDIHKDWESPSERCRLVERQFPNFKYLRGWTWEKVGEVKSYGPIDILFIDSWHEYDYFARDWNDYAPLCAAHNIVMVDDLQFGGVGTAYSTIPCRYKADFLDLNPGSYFGIMIDVDRDFKFNYDKRDYMP